MPELHALLPRCQILSLHVPGGAATEGLIGAAELALLPAGAVLVNAARGSLLDEDALFAALDSGHLAAAGLDVFRNEPHVDPRFLDHPRLFLTPHVGSATLETPHRHGDAGAGQHRRVLRRTGAGRPGRLTERAMEFDHEALAPDARYRLLASSVAPRPGAWITSQDADGLVNAAPYSFFNAVSADPPILGVGIGNREAPERDTPKDTKANIRASGQFVVNLVDEGRRAGDEPHRHRVPRTTSARWRGPGLETVPSVRVRPPRPGDEPGQPRVRGCTWRVPLGPAFSLVLGRVLRLHVRDTLVRDAGRQHLATERMAPLGRMHGGGTFARATDLLRIDRIPAGRRLPDVHEPRSSPPPPSWPGSAAC